VCVVVIAQSQIIKHFCKHVYGGGGVYLQVSFMSKIDSKKPISSKILSAVVEDRGFHFCTAEGIYTKVTATSLSDFNEKLDGIDDSSILFHYPRGDFQAWIRDVLGDNELADRMCFIAPNLPGEKLRKELQRIVQNRIKELTAIPL
jgi:hypothetical protein